MPILLFAKIQAVLGLALGLVLGILYSFGGLLVDTLVSLDLLDKIKWETPGLSQGTLLAFGALLGMPFIFGAIGFIRGLLAAPVYNFLAKKFKGFQIQV